MRTILLPAFLSLAILCGPSYSEERSTVHRKAVSNPDGSGWQIAKPTGGNFTVLLPCLFNDFSTEGADPKYPVLNARMVACRLEDRAQFSAVQLEYRSEADAAAQFEKVKASPGARLLKDAPAGYGGRPTLEVTMSLVNLVGTTRAILVGKTIVQLTAEWRPSAPIEAAYPNKFFASARVGT